MKKNGKLHINKPTLIYTILLVTSIILSLVTPSQTVTKIGIIGLLICIITQQKTQNTPPRNREKKAPKEKPRKEPPNTKNNKKLIQLTGGIAHEINNPLGFIENNIFALQLTCQQFKEMHLLIQNHLDNKPTSASDNTTLNQNITALNIHHKTQDLDQLFHETIDGIERIKNLIKSLKSFATCQKKNTQIPSNINEAIRQTCLLTKHQYKNQIQLETHLTTLPLLTCQEQEIQQVFLNIILNAVHAIKVRHKLGKEGLLKIVTKEENNTIQILFSDNGTGMQKADLDRILDPFYTTKKKSGGTGLGLTICQEIIENHKGTIQIESTYGQGTDITLSLPCKVAQPC